MRETSKRALQLPCLPQHQSSQLDQAEWRDCKTLPQANQGSFVRLLPALSTNLECTLTLALSTHCLPRHLYLLPVPPPTRHPTFRPFRTVLFLGTADLPKRDEGYRERIGQVVHLWNSRSEINAATV